MKIKNDFSADKELSIYIGAIEKKYKTSLSNIEEFYVCTIDDFELEVDYNQAVYMYSIEGMLDDNSIPFSADLYDCKGDKFTFESDILIEFANSDKVYKRQQSMYNIALSKIENTQNLRQGRAIGYKLTFEDNLRQPPIPIPDYGVFDGFSSELYLENSQRALYILGSPETIKLDIVTKLTLQDLIDMFNSPLGAGFLFEFNSIGGGDTFAYIEPQDEIGNVTFTLTHQGNSLNETLDFSPYLDKDTKITFLITYGSPNVFLFLNLDDVNIGNTLFAGSAPQFAGVGSNYYIGVNTAKNQWFKGLIKSFDFYSDDTVTNLILIPNCKNGINNGDTENFTPVNL